MDPETSEGSPKNEANEPKKTESEIDSNEKLWDSIGFHCPLAGFYYNLIFWFASLIFGIFFGAYLMKLLYPFPESGGYKAAGTAMFGLFFTIMDLGTANVVNRYLGESSVKNPYEMLKYIQYFIWYQSFTGLLQTTAVSLYALYYVPRTELIYVIWIMLIQSTTQFPGYLWIFKDILGAMQQFHKTTILGFITGDIIQRITEIAFVLYGNYYGRMHPEVGVIMGIAIGSMIGTYVDDFIAMVVSTVYFRGFMKHYGIRFRRCWGHDFDSKLVKDCLTYGLRIGIPGLFWPAVGLFAFWLWILYVPQYTTFSTLAGFAGTFSGITSQGLGLGGSISQAYMNDKKELTRYYVGQAWRFAGFMQGLLITIILMLIPVLGIILLYFGLEYYILSLAFIIPQIVRNFQQPYNNISEDVIIQTNHPNASMMLHFYEDAVAFITWAVLLAWLKLPQRYGLIAIIWIMPCGELIAIVSKTILNYIFIHKKIFKLQIPLWQTFIAPFLSGLVMYLIGMAFINGIFLPINENFGIFYALVLLVIFGIFCCPIFIYAPLTALFGGWDDDALVIFRKVAQMSGPSKFFVIPIYKIIARVSKISPFHNRFKMDASAALREGDELTKIKNQWYVL